MVLFNTLSAGRSAPRLFCLSAAVTQCSVKVMAGPGRTDLVPYNFFLNYLSHLSHTVYNLPNLHTDRAKLMHQIELNSQLFRIIL